MDIKLKELLATVEREIEKAEKNYLEAKKSASEVAATAAHSLSQAGDRFHSQGASDLAKERLDSLKRLETEIKSGTVKYFEKDGAEFFLVKNVTLLSGIKLISLHSPVGKELLKDVE